MSALAVALDRPQPYFEPWVGRNYQAGGAFLILGESHYGPPDLPGNFTQVLTQEYADGEWNHRFWTNIMQAVMGRPYWEIDRNEFWASVAFYNYVQQPVAETAGVAPTSEMFMSSKTAFFSVLNRLKPKSVLVLSKRLWDNLPAGGRAAEDIRHEESRREALIYPHDGGEAIATWIPHPSYGFSWRRWHPWLARLRALNSDGPLGGAPREVFC